MSTSSCEETLCKVESVFAKTVDPAASTLLAAPCMILICIDSCEARPKGKQIEHIEPSLQLQNQESMFTNCIVLVNQPTGIYRIQNKCKAGFLRLQLIENREKQNQCISMQESIEKAEYCREFLEQMQRRLYTELLVVLLSGC